MATYTERKVEAAARALDDAEKAIQKILLDLENEHGVRTKYIEVDARAFGNYRVEITTTSNVK